MEIGCAVDSGGHNTGDFGNSLFFAKSFWRGSGDWTNSWHASTPKFSSKIVLEWGFWLWFSRWRHRQIPESFSFWCGFCGGWFQRRGYFWRRARQGFILSVPFYWGNWPKISCFDDASCLYSAFSRYCGGRRRFGFSVCQDDYCHASYSIVFSFRCVFPPILGGFAFL